MGNDTVAYYEAYAEQFAARTRDIDMSAIRARFLAYVPHGGAVLDAGCGAGRDIRAFADAGFRVTAFDASPKMCHLASEYAGQEVLHLRFDEIDWAARFDGVWACASLLHLPMTELPGTLARLTAALKPGGALYTSFKRGQGERSKEGRHFLDLDEETLRGHVTKVPGLRLAELWVTGDARPRHGEAAWVNAIALKDNGQTRAAVKHG